jgi:hypothetical protein
MHLLPITWTALKLPGPWRPRRRKWLDSSFWLPVYRIAATVSAGITCLAENLLQAGAGEVSLRSDTSASNQHPASSQRAKVRGRGIYSASADHSAGQRIAIDLRLTLRRRKAAREKTNIREPVCAVDRSRCGRAAASLCNVKEMVAMPAAFALQAKGRWMNP